MPQTICPVCDKPTPKSNYLRQEFKGDQDALDAALLVTHYRHAHAKHYDYAWKNRKDKKTGYSGMEHEEFRSQTNNACKLALIEALERKKLYSTIRGFLKLQDNTPEVVARVEEVLGEMPKKK